MAISLSLAVGALLVWAVLAKRAAERRPITTAEWLERMRNLGLGVK